MNHTIEPISEALDRLARVADTNPIGDPMPGIKRKARANRRRATALVACGLAATVTAGVTTVSLLDLPGLAGDNGYANSPSTSPTSAPSTPSSPPREPALAEYDQAQADVDGDGAADTIRVLVPEADADEGMDMSMDVRLEVEFAADVATVELRLGEMLIPTIAGTPDLEGNGTDEVVLSFSGGDAGWLRVFTWNGDTLVQAEPGPDSMADLVDGGALYSEEGVASSALVDGGLISWVPTNDESAPFEVRVWTWQLDGTLLVATEAEQIQCFRPGEQSPKPC
jgi:hypothetical protein